MGAWASAGPNEKAYAMDKGKPSIARKLLHNSRVASSTGPWHTVSTARCRSGLCRETRFLSYQDIPGLVGHASPWDAD